MIQKVTPAELSNIIDTYEPEGCFYAEENDIFVACDNSTSDAWVEEFATEEEAVEWLEREGGE